MNATTNFNESLLAAPTVSAALPLIIADKGTFPIALTSLVTALVALLTYYLRPPAVHPKSPAFTSDTSPIIGSFGYISRQLTWYKKSVKESTSGHFSFRLGRRHVIGLSGVAARKWFFEEPLLDLVTGAVILPFGVHFWPPIHDIFKPDGNRARNNTFFLRRMLEMMKTDKLEKQLFRCIGDARECFETILADSPTGVINLPELWKPILRQNCRLFVSSDIADDPKQFKKVSDCVDTLLHTYSVFNVFFKWLPSPAYWTRRLARYGLVRFFRQMYNQRMSMTPEEASRKDDPFQSLINNGDPEPYINEYFTSAAFITTTNAHVISSQMLENMAIHQEWQQKCFEELQTVANKYAGGMDVALVDKIPHIPLKAWETSFPTMHMCLNELIRSWSSFGVMRYNTSPNAIPIPGSDEVLPGHTFAIYHTGEPQFSSKLYPEPSKFDPTRFLEGREEFKQEPYGFHGWGGGTHPCTGMRWAKLQQYIMLANALALWKLSSCDKDGNVDPYAKERQRGLDVDLDSETPFKLPPALCKFEPRERLQ
ncbi:hypothetical protein CBER1_08988 [Cercospora berteroae]|uniref:Cytochrome P450 n=1 Tax=Cercospora berteroae TaxID=357750 RepID=A0A2S6CKB7_9PEZI|nr:hypothetical protein CBER1_08988 [Cercospora berteroae]